MDLGIEGKSALIAASSQGLGFAVAKALLHEGVNVGLCARTETTLEQAQVRLQGEFANQTVAASVGDLASADDRQRIVAECQAQLGSIDILVTNTGGPPTGAFEQHDDAAWLKAHHQLLASAVGLVRGVLPDMKAKNWGRIIAITSQAVKQPVQNLVLSNSVRASVVGLMRTLANELGPFGITVNNVMPGFTETARLQSLMSSSSAFDRVTEEIPLGRLGQPDEFAAMVAFLASAKASYVSGTSVAVDGGWIRSLM